LQSIYEAGARITHDIKNLLQSLKTLTSIVEQTDALSSEKQTLIKSQLPHLSQRLQLALDKLQSPRDVQQQHQDIQSWSSVLGNRLDQKDITITKKIQSNHEIPVDLFDSVIDNLLENISNKKQQETDITTTIDIYSNDDEIFIFVTDSGTAIPDNKASRLFSEAVDSENGLGIGIYQAYRQAELYGYKLSLENNVNGNVCFKLSNIN